MKSKRLLYAVIISTIITATSLTNFYNNAKAEDIIINGTGNTNYTDDIWENGVSNSSGLVTSEPGNTNKTYETWGKTGETSNVLLQGGSLTIDSTKNGYLQATEGSLIINQNATLEIKNNSSIAKAVDLTINQGGKLDITNGNVTLDTGDSWNGNLTISDGILNLEDVAQNGDLNQTGGITNIIDDQTLGSGEFSISGGELNIDADKLLTITDGTITTDTKINLNQDAVLNITNTSQDGITLNQNDTWEGKIQISDGILNLDGVTQKGELIQINNGTTNIISNQILGTADTSIDGGYLNLKENNTLTMKDGLVGLNTSVNLEQNTVLNIENTTSSTEGFVLDSFDDTWEGAINLSGGTLTMYNRVDQTDDKQIFNQTGGTLNVADNGCLILNTADSSITGGSVILGENNYGTFGEFIVNNGLDNNQARVFSMISNESNFSVTGENTKFTTLTNTYFQRGSVIVGDGNTTSTLNLTSNNEILKTVALNVADKSILNVICNDESTVAIDGNNDKYEGDINLISGEINIENMSLRLGNKSTTAGGIGPYYSQQDGDLILGNTQLTMADASLISGGGLAISSDSTFKSELNGFNVSNFQNAGLVDAVNGHYENYVISDLFGIGDDNGDNQGDFKIDLSARGNGKYDSFGSDTATFFAGNEKNATINISEWSIDGDLFGGDAPIDKNIHMNIFKGKVEAGQNIDFTATGKELLTPIGWYKLGSNGGGNYSLGLTNYNPGVFRGQVATIAQYQNQLMIGDLLFNHTMVDQGFKGNDYIASNPNRLASSSDLYPPYQYSRKDGGLWLKSYGTFEKLNMNHGLNVGNNAYGTIIGADFGLKDLRKGWQFMPTAYIGYNGAHQYWQGYGAYQNGGQAGFLGTWYKNNFIIGALIYGGVYSNEMSTPRGNDDTFNYFGGGSVKTAYNWNFARNWALQPNLLVAYNYFGQQNWHTDFGQMGMMSGMLHGVNIAPGVNLIYERDTFSVYGTLQYMYNVNQASGGRAGNVDLPNVHMDRGYIQYGIGLNKKFTDIFSGYLQTVIRNVGRTGIGVQLGFQWRLGSVSDGNYSRKTNSLPESNKLKITLNGNKF